MFRISSDKVSREAKKVPNTNAGNPAGFNDVIGNQVIQNAAQNLRVQNVGNPNGLMGVQGNGNLVAVRAEGNAAGHNGNQIRCYNCRGVGHFARDCTARPRRRDAAYLQTQLLIAQKEEVGIQLQAEEYDLMAAAAYLDEIEETDSTSVYDSDGSAEDSSKNTKFAKQPIAEILPKICETKALSKPVTSNSISKPPVSKGVNNAKVIAPGMFRISLDKKGMNSNSNGLSSTGLDNTKTRRPQPRSNTKNDRVPSASKSSRSMNKDVKVEEHHRNLLLSNSKVICDKCKKCLNSVNHDVCLNNCVNGKKSRGRKHKANVSKNETQQKNQPEIKKPKNVGTHESLATPKPRKPRFLLRWSSTGKMFDSTGKLVAPSGCSKHMTGNLKLLINFVWKFMGTVRFGNDHVAAILGFGDLQWGNILITSVYFIEGLGHNLFSVGQFCDSDLEVAFRRNACFVRNLEGVDLLKRDRSTNLYTINLHEMASWLELRLLSHGYGINVYPT
nr:integrase, catalytic region, zinc finger, CCHC-type, peptidase aspartic, catalytic [Tanacetum cinerariifolium]